MRKRDGFTLIESVIAIMLMGIIGTIIAAVISTTFDTMADINIRKEAVQNGANAASFLSREVGMVGADTALVYANSDSIRFNDRWGQVISYGLSGAALYRRVDSGTTRILAESVVVDSSSFHYYGVDNVELSSVPLSTTDRKKVRLIELQLQTDDAGQGVNFLIRVFPENLKVIRG